MSVAEGTVDLRDRNRRLVRILLAVVGTLILASFMVGVRW